MLTGAALSKDVLWRLPAHLMLPGGAVGNVKSWAENQKVTVVPAVAVTVTGLAVPDWFAWLGELPPASWSFH